jgi:hypothetical protein
MRDEMKNIATVLLLLSSIARKRFNKTFAGDFRIAYKWANIGVSKPYCNVGGLIESDVR